jgi:acyl-CoA reductase-like NAD-dependent aldehyde dehydrogenase
MPRSPPPRRRSRPGRRLPAPQRAKLVRKLGELIAAHVPEIARTETNDTAR